MRSIVAVDRARDAKRTGGITRKLVFALLVVVVVPLPGAAALAASTSTEIVPGTATVAGRGYGYWVVADYRWRVSLPNITPNTSKCFSARQTGPVWFLSGSAVPGYTVTRTCRVPAGRYLMLDVPSVECSTVERPPFYAATDAGLKRCVRTWWRKRHGGLNLSLDGAPIRPAGYVGGTNVYSFTMPAQNNFLGAPGVTSGRAAVYGSASILRPLTPGNHLLVVVDTFKHPYLLFTSVYKLTVG